MGDWTKSVDPTCTENGTEISECTVDGCVYFESRPLNKLGHMMGDWTEITAPTCTDGGTLMRSCTRDNCTYTKEMLVAKLGHEFEAEFTVDTVPTCSTTGSESRHCIRCDATSEAREIARYDHMYSDGVVSVPASSGQVGVMSYTCYDCGHVRTEIIEKIAPTITEQSSESWTSWSESESAVFRSNAAIEDFVAVKVNGEILSADCYVIREGSTVIELKGNYLGTLQNGEYTVEIVSKTGTATSTMVVEKNFFANPWVWGSMIAVVSCALIAMAVIFILKFRKTYMLAVGSQSSFSTPKSDESSDQTASN